MGLYNNDKDVDLSEYEKEQFKLIVDDVFSITGKGIVVLGKIISGQIFVGDKVYINYDLEVEVCGIEMFRKMLDSAHRGDNIGLLLGNIDKSDVQIGDIITKK